MVGTGTANATNDTNSANNTATFSVLGTAADMSASFAGFPASAPANSVVTGTANFVNTNATNTATTAVFTITIKPGLGVANVTVTSVLLGNGTYDNTTGVVTFTPPTVVNVTPSGTVSASISFLQTSTGVVGTGTANATNDTNPANNTGTFSVGVGADVGTTLALPTTAVPGSTVTGTVTFFNSGASAANNVTRTVALAGGTLTAVTGGTVASGSVTATFPVATLAAGNSASFTFTYVVPASGTVKGTSTITTTSAEATPANNFATATTIITGTGVDLSVTLTLSPGLLVPVSGTVVGTNTVTITITNVGSLPSGGSVTVNLPPGVGNPTGATVNFVISTPLAAGQSIVFTTSYVLSAAQTTSQTFTASVTAFNGADINPTNDVSSLIVGLGANLQGRAWIDSIRSGTDFRTYQVGETLLPNVLVKLTNSSSVVVGTALTNELGEYRMTGIQPGTGYTLQFFNCLTAGGSSDCNAIGTTPINQGATTTNGNSNAAAVTTVETSVNGGTFGQKITGVSVYAGDNTVSQNLPIDPSGVVYRTDSRVAVNGATMSLYGPYGPGGAQALVPVQNLVGGINTCTSGGTCPGGQPGGYEYILKDGGPGFPFVAGTYVISVTPPAGFSTSSIAPGTFPTSPVAAGADVFVQSQSGPPQGAAATTYYLSFNLALNSANIYFNHIPIDAVPNLASGALLVSKTGNKTVAELGDSVQYTIRIRNTTLLPITNIQLQDLLPAGFRYILGTSRLGTTTLTDPAGGVGRELTFAIGTINGQTSAELTYFVRLGVGSQQGDGINRATVVSPVRSNTALFKVNVQGGVFSNDGCISGKVYVDCDGNGIQNNSGGSREVGIPGVRLVMLDGSFFITDSEGKYSVCGIKSQTHVVKVDRTTLPKGSRLVPSSNRNAGVGDSLFVDLKGGELARADFIEGSCSPEVLDQVKARRAQGGVTSPETEKALPLQIQNRPGEVPQQILPSVRQQDLLPSNPGVVQ